MSDKSLFLLLLAAIGLQGTVSAQDLLAEKPVYALGEAKTWVSSNDETYTMITEDLSKLTAVPTNTSNIYLFPETGGGWATDENKAIGIQGFYVDMGASQSVGTVTTTWEGAAANAYDIYLTDAEPTAAILSATPTYSATGLGQYQSNTAVLPDGSKGRYLVFQPTDATNWGWGVKIRSIAATAPQKAELTTFTATPGLVAPNVPTQMTLTVLDQLGLVIEDYELSVSENATFADGMLTVASGLETTLTVTYDGKSLSTVIYSATMSPGIPTLAIDTPIFTNGDDSANGTAEFVTAYNGGAINNGLITFADGQVAQSFSNTRCVFFSNSETTGAWNGNINPDEHGYYSLNLTIFATRNVEGNINFEGTDVPDVVPVVNTFTLTAGQWNPIQVKVAGATRLNNMSVRFDEANMSDIMLANIFFTKDLETSVADVDVEDEFFDVYTMQGYKLLSGATADAVKTLPGGLYIINGKKVVIR